MKTAIHLMEYRKKRGLSASHLAQEVGVTRQTIYAIESGDYVPNTTVALRLASTLEVSVEDLFCLIDESSDERSTAVDVIELPLPTAGHAATVARVGERLIAVPQTTAPVFLPAANAVLTPDGKAVLLDKSTTDKTVVIAGCDPAISILADELARNAGVQLVAIPCSSREALLMLKAGRAHMAGMHLRDDKSGDYNLPIAAKAWKGKKPAVVTYAIWEQGILTARDNPKQILKPMDLLKKDVTIINREEGSGARQLLDAIIHEAGGNPAKIRGYDNIAFAHLQAAVAVSHGEADACIATNSSARMLGLEFLSLSRERYDFVIAPELRDNRVVQAVVETLQLASLRRKLELLAGYETTSTGVAQNL